MEALIKTRGEHLARQNQNHVLVLVPSFVEVTRRGVEQLGFAPSTSSASRREQQEIVDSARRVVAIDLLRERPDAYGVRAAQLGDREIQKQFATEELEFANRIARAYNHLYYPAANNQIMRKNIGGASIETGAAICQDIFNKLTAEGELLTSTSIKQDILRQLANLFFQTQETVSLERLRQSFSELRSWPILENSSVFTDIVRQGVEKGHWCVYRMADPQSTTPTEIYDQDNPLPLHADWLAADHSLVSVAGAKQRGWIGVTGPQPEELIPIIYEQVKQEGQITISSMQGLLNEQFGEAVEQAGITGITQAVQSGQVLVLRDSLADGAAPTLLAGPDVHIFQPHTTDQLLTPARAAELGLIAKTNKGVTIFGRQQEAQKFHNLMSRLGSFYQRGATSAIDRLELSELDLDGAGNITVSFEGLQPSAMDQVGELLAMLASISKVTAESELRLTINKPQDKDPWWADLNK